MVIVKEQVLIRSSERGSVLLIARCAKGRKKILFPILTQNVLYVRVAEETLVINFQILFAKGRGMFLNTKLMSMQNLIRFRFV